MLVTNSQPVGGRPGQLVSSAAAWLLAGFCVSTPARSPAQTDAPVVVQIDWSKTGAEVSPGAYGLNVFGGLDPAVAANAHYRDGLAHMRPGLLRVHSWNMMKDAAKSPEGWLDFAHNTWDAARVRSALAALPPDTTDGAALLINIPGWPDWMKKLPDGRLDPAEHEAFARFCAELVRIANVDAKRNVRLWEITNERDEVYWVNQKKANAPDALDELAGLYNRCVVAMKAVDPTIQTGGPAATRADFVPELRRFMHAARVNLDFFSVHVYASGDADDADAKVFARPRAWATTVGKLAAALGEELPGRTVPLFVDEYNISWTWETRDVRMRNYKGAVFDALALANLLGAGATATSAWNECDGTYGKMDQAFARRPAAEIFHQFNTDFRPGRLVEAVSSDPARLTAFAVVSDKGGALALINPGAQALRARLEFPPPGPGPFAAARIACQVTDGDGTRETAINADTLLGKEIVLPPFSVSTYRAVRE